MQLYLSRVPGMSLADGRLLPLAPRDAALLAWLALEGPTPRARLASLLWPDAEVDAARNALRQRLFQLKRQCGLDPVAGTSVLSLADGVRHDLDDADSVLGDVALTIGTEYDAWIEQQRVRRHARARQSLADLAEMAERVKDYADALSHAHELLALDPLSEAAHRRVIRLHYLAGDRAGALLAFDRCERLLKNEVGARPSDETLALLLIIESASARAELRPQVLPASLRRPPLDVGRERERRDLLAAWNAGQRFLVLGEAGIGKSRLLDTVAAAWPGALVVRARPGDSAVPLALVTRLVEALGEQQPAWQRRPAAAELRAMLAGLPAPAPDGSGPRPTPRPLQPLLFEALVPDGDTPPALMFDDWQFADNASVALLGEALDAAPLAALRMGMASRASAGAMAELRIARLREHSDVRIVALEPLDATQVTELLESLRLGAVDVPGLAATLAQRVGGNPLFLLEALRHMLEASTPLLPQNVTVPRHVKDMVARRLAALPERARQLLRAAAVAGSDFDVALAEAVTGRHALELAESWAVLEQQGLFGSQGIGHDVYAEAVLAQLPEAIARALHARVAACLEDRPHEPARLAAHWRASGEDGRAVVHLVAAARQAWHASRPEDTFELFEQAACIESARGHADAAFDLWFDNADAMSEIGSPALTRRCVPGLEDHARTEVQRLRVRLVQAVLQALSGDLEAGMSAVVNLLGDAIALGDERVEAECRFAIANRASADGRFDDALQHLAAGERLMREAGDVRRAAALAATMALVIGLRGQPRLALREYERMLPLLEAENDRATWTVVCASAALQHMRQGEVEAALREARRARASAAQASIAPPDTAVILRNLLDTLRWSERLDEALQVCDEFGSRLSRQGDFPRAREPIAALFLQLGRADLAKPLVEALAVQAPARAREQLRLRLLRWQLDSMSSVPIRPQWPIDALANEDLALAAEWGLWSGLVVDSPYPLEQLQALAGRCRQAGMRLLAAPLEALVAWRRQGSGQAAEGDRADLDAIGLEGLHGAVPWTALYAARALHDAGRCDAAAALAQAGGRWLEATARTALPPAFRDAYLHRSPVNRELLALAAKRCG